MASYLIEFDTMPGHTPGTSATLPSEALNLMGWRSIGHPRGGRFLNRTGVTIRAFYLKIQTPGNVFGITSSSGGRLFNTIWTRTNDAGEVVEVYFLDGNIPTSFSPFWMRVPENTAEEIQNCDAQQECPFAGKALEENPAFPVEPGWSVFHTTPPPQDNNLARLIEELPSDYRAVGSFAQSDDKRHVLLEAAGELILYDRLHQTISSYNPAKTATIPPIDAISFDADNALFRLSKDGKAIRSIDPKATELFTATP